MTSSSSRTALSLRAEPTSICWRSTGSTLACIVSSTRKPRRRPRFQAYRGGQMSHSIIVLPDDSARPVLDAINGATKSLRIKMFVFSDPELLEAVVAAQQRGVKVQVMLNHARRSGEEDNEQARALLTEGGVEVLDSNPAFYLTHENSMVV